MEIDWAQRQLAGYTQDGQRALRCLMDGDITESLLARALGLLRTYLALPERVSAESSPAMVMTQLAWVLHNYIHDRGYWDDIGVLWPKLRLLTEHLPAPYYHAEITKQLAITRNSQGAAKEAQQLYEDLTRSPIFPELASEQQASLWHQLGVCYDRQGDVQQAQRMFIQCLQVPNQPDAAADYMGESYPEPRKMTSGRFAAAPLWASKAFALNQLGNISLTQGDVECARCYYEQALRMLVNNGEENGMACVAYQTLGRFFLHQGCFLEATPFLENNLRVRRYRTEQDGAAHAAIYLAAAYLGQSRYPEAAALLNEALTTSCALGNKYNMALCHLYASYLEWHCGNPGASVDQWQQAQKLMETLSVSAIEIQVAASLVNELPHFQLDTVCA